MKKQTQTLLLLAGAGALGYFLLKGKKSGARMIQSEAEAAESTETGKGAENMPEQPEVDAVIDTTKTGQTVRQAIQQGKELATALQDANIIVKTPDGQPNVQIQTGVKKVLTEAERQARRLAKAARRKALAAAEQKRIAEFWKTKRAAAKKRKADEQKRIAEFWKTKRAKAKLRKARRLAKAARIKALAVKKIPGKI